MFLCFFFFCFVSHTLFCTKCMRCTTGRDDALTMTCSWINLSYPEFSSTVNKGTIIKFVGHIRIFRVLHHVHSNNSLFFPHFYMSNLLIIRLIVVDKCEFFEKQLTLMVWHHWFSGPALCSTWCRRMSATLGNVIGYQISIGQRDWWKDETKRYIYMYIWCRCAYNSKLINKFIFIIHTFLFLRKLCYLHCR